MENIDWQPILIAAIAALSLINGLSVFQNFRTDRAKVIVEPVYEDDWMFWTELKDPKGSADVRRYAVIGHMAQCNMGRRPSSIAKVILKIRLRNMRTAPSGLYAIPAPEVEISSAETQRLPVMKPGPDPFDFRPMLQPGQSVAGVHCFLFGMYGSESWSPRSDNGVLEGTVEMESGFGNIFKSKASFRYVEFSTLEKLFPTLETFMLNNLDNSEA